jgi:hypothetical protein
MLSSWCETDGPMLGFNFRKLVVEKPTAVIFAAPSLAYFCIAEACFVDCLRVQQSL